jgi:hypothetical protein
VKLLDQVCKELGCAAEGVISIRINAEEVVVVATYRGSELQIIRYAPSGQDGYRISEGRPFAGPAAHRGLE